jgi:hypothetical protein
MARANPDAWLPTLRRLLAEAFALHQKGAAGVPLGRAYGAADGFMLALIELGATNSKELSALVADERFRLMGPATRILIDREAAPRGEARPFAGIGGTRAGAAAEEDSANRSSAATAAVATAAGIAAQEDEGCAA